MDVGSVPAAATPPTTQQPSGQSLMIAYDGSPNADRAIRYAAHFLRPRVVHVVTAWEPGGLSASRLSALSGGMHPFVDSGLEADVDDALRDEAAAINDGGVELATSLDLDATGSLVEVETNVWGALVAAADTLDVDVLVTGTRGESGLKALLHSSVAGRVLKHCHRPVFIVPAKCDHEPIDCRSTDQQQ